jgi:prepilin-type N-terminal cleavage/methylation domain-containing protein
VKFHRISRPEAAFTLVELSVSMAIFLVLASLSLTAGKKVHESASLAVSANNIRQLAAGGINYLSEHNQRYWPYKFTDPVTRDVTVPAAITVLGPNNARSDMWLILL